MFFLNKVNVGEYMGFFISIVIFVAVFLLVYDLMPEEKVWLMVFITPVLYIFILFIVYKLFSLKKRKKPTTDKREIDDKNLPWYLRKKLVFFFCIVLPPIGYILVFSHLKKLDYNQKINYLTLATVMLSIWVLMFLPNSVALYFWSLVLAIVIGNVILKLLNGKK